MCVCAPSPIHDLYENPFIRIDTIVEVKSISAPVVYFIFVNTDPDDTNETYGSKTYRVVRVSHGVYSGLNGLGSWRNWAGFRRIRSRIRDRVVINNFGEASLRIHIDLVNMSGIEVLGL